jgi:hypothetical protein
VRLTDCWCYIANTLTTKSNARPVRNGQLRTFSYSLWFRLIVLCEIVFDHNLSIAYSIVANFPGIS